MNALVKELVQSTEENKQKTRVKGEKDSSGSLQIDLPEGNFPVSFYPPIFITPYLFYSPFFPERFLIVTRLSVCLHQ